MTTSPEDVERALADGRDLKDWWDGVENGRNTVEFFELASPFAGGDALRGFFGEAQAGGKTIPVMGYTGDYFFDLACVSPAERPQAATWLGAQAEEFALGYWLRTEAWALPQSYPRLGLPDLPRYLRALSLFPPVKPELTGMANLQRTYKLRDSGQVGAFPTDDMRAVIDARALDTQYEWVTLERHPVAFELNFAIGATGLGVAIPFPGAGRFVMSSDFTVRRQRPSPGVVGEFGVGFATMRPDTGIPLGPISTPPGLRYQTLRVMESAEIRVRTVTLMSRSPGVLKFILEPASTGRHLAYEMTMGLSSRFLSGITASEVERYILTTHAFHLRDALLGTRAAWQQVGDWLDPGGIPSWVKEGKAA